MFILTILQISVFKEGQVRLQAWIFFLLIIWCTMQIGLHWFIHVLSFFISFNSVYGSFILQTALHILHWIEQQQVQSIIAIFAVNQLQSFFFHFLFPVSYLYILLQLECFVYHLNMHYRFQYQLHCMIFITWWTWFLSR